MQGLCDGYLVDYWCEYIIFSEIYRRGIYIKKRSAVGVYTSNWVLKICEEMHNTVFFYLFFIYPQNKNSFLVFKRQIFSMVLNIESLFPIRTQCSETHLWLLNRCTQLPSCNSSAYYPLFNRNTLRCFMWMPVNVTIQCLMKSMSWIQELWSP